MACPSAAAKVFMWGRRRLKPLVRAKHGITRSALRAEIEYRARPAGGSCGILFKSLREDLS